MGAEFIGIRTRTLTPPKDDLFSVMGESLPKIFDGDIILIATKVLAIHLGKCVPKAGTDKLKLIREEADCVPQMISDPCITIRENTLIPNSGIDESNGNGYYVLWPRNVGNLLREIHAFVLRKFRVKNFGVIAVDSCVLPMRTGTVGISQCSFGFVPVVDLIGKNDLFGRPVRMSKINVADALAGIAPLVMGETSESRPMVLVRGVEGVSFSNEEYSNHLPRCESDLFRPMLDFFRGKQNSPHANTNPMHSEIERQISR
ncbi:MAG: coenzyme F420-0:L-glutamate ligase [Puniceicoccales bacterium]|jgi:F420-0:gamma-glutamyl ligase|nr:coenzyme F420-0:L-glutamate ligase [Puniceicoccales bacterium]